MKISYRWLLEYVKTPLSPAELGDRFRLTSSEIEGMEEWGSRFAGLVVGKVMSVAKHPNADKLRTAEVNVGSGPLRHIVCGAPNLAEGQAVIVALPGVTLYPVKGDPFAIAEAVIRGEKSQGMLCAAEEIGLPLPSDGILVLDGDIVPGTPAAKALSLDDTVLDLEVTPNRPDLLSYVGLAREVAAFDKKRLLEPPLAATDEGGEGRLSVEIEDGFLCPRYTAISLSMPSIGQSPLWIQTRLLLSGVRPVDAVVDITNYCMLEYGQPLHAFDLDALAGRGVRVRSARDGESIAILDGSERSLQKGDIVIADAKDGLLAIAGVMGGAESGVSASTSHILLESATFHGPQIRRTSRRLGLRSEASTRFEKGLDPDATITALKRAVCLLQEICGATVTSQIHDRFPGKGRVERPRIHLSFARIQEITGIHISAPEAKGILQRLGFQVSSLTKSSFDTTPPSWRQDVSMPEDVVEELIRIWGFERLPSSMPAGAVRAPQGNPFFEKKSLIRRILAGMGMHECLHLTFASATEYARLGLDTALAVRLDNPLSAQTEFLITTHALPLLGNLGGANLGESEISLFEMGHVFSAPQTETEMLSFVVRSATGVDDLYRQAKAAIERIAFQLRLPAPRYSEGAGMAFMESPVDVFIGDVAVGTLGAVSETVVGRLKIRSGRNLVYVQINLDVLLGIEGRQRLYEAPAPYPGIGRDMTILIAKDRPVGDIGRLIAAAPNAVRTSWEITDIFSGKPLDAKLKSVTIHFNYSSPERTLEDREATQDQESLAAAFTEQLGAAIS